MALINWATLKWLLIQPRETMEALKDGMTSSQGLRFALVLLFSLIIINVIFAGVFAVVEGKNVAMAAAMTLLASIPTLIITLVGLIVIGFFSIVLAKRVFKCSADVDGQVGLTCHAVVPFFVVGVLSNLVVLTHVFTAGTLTAVLKGFSSLLFLAALVWLLALSYFALRANCQLDFKTTAFSTIISFLLAVLVLIPINFIFDYLLGLVVIATGFF